MSNQEFLPFYERVANRISNQYIVGRVLVCAILGLAFLVPHYAVLIWNREKLTDWSWFLGLLIAAAMLCLYQATYSLNKLFPEMDARLPKTDKEVYLSPLKKRLSDRKFIYCGIAFGFLNCAFGYSFGLPYSKLPLVITILLGYFLAGFVCGMAVWGIYGVFEPIKVFSRKARESFDFTAPDHCGGTAFLGDALIIFSSVTLIVGVMISIYILKTDWQRQNTAWVMALKMAWIIFPYACSVLVLIGPALPINGELADYKTQTEFDFQNYLARVRANLENEVAADKRKDLREHYEFQQNRRKELHAMRTWPFSLRADIKYGVTFFVNSAAHYLLGKTH
jgi:hypothetical protein